MALKIDFNNPEMLQVHLAQALSQHGFEGVRNRILIGDSGGLAYMLVPRPTSARLIDIRKHLETTPADNVSFANYVNAARDYVRFSENHAQQHEFKLLKYGESEEVTLDNIPFSYGIGDNSIESLEKFKRFLEMIKQGRVELDRQYETVAARARDAANSIFLIRN